MFSWLTGAGGETGGFEDTDVTTIAEGPDTPAHVFAYRAVQSRVWGTPKPKPKQRSKAIVAAKEDASAAISGRTGNGSPTKPNGILMTPGTGAIKRYKSVTFGSHVADPRERTHSRPSNIGVPDALPGKFPSPYTPRVTIQKELEVPESANVQTKLTKALHEARGAGKAHGSTNTAATDKMDTVHADEYWKVQYESYAERTKREMRKLVVKQKAAKSYAKQKDAQAIDLADKLRTERKKVDKLEAKVAELSAQLDAYQNDKRQPPRAATAVRPTHIGVPERTLTHIAITEEQPRPGARNASLKDSDRSPTRSRRPLSLGDMWADAAGSSPMIENAPDRSTLNPSDTLPSPLKARDVNTLYNDRPDTRPRVSPSRASVARRTSQRQPNAPGTGRSARSARSIVDDFGSILDLPQASPEPFEQSLRAKSMFRIDPKGLEEDVIPLSPSESSPPKYDRMALPYAPPTGQTASTFPTRDTHGNKENTLPVQEARPSDTSAVKPLVSPAKVQTDPAVDRKKQLGEERAAKAKARIEARRLEKERQQAQVS